ncbi:MAG: hypothetical protein K0R34_2495 [Herbinix sp.]|jgi:hypothetical protein|nr:hypothetical protein [Herbinix sp.]
MNSKELLEQARKTAEKQLSLIDDIMKAERSLELAIAGKICFCTSGYGNVYLEDTTEPEAMEVVKDLGLTAIMKYRDNRIAELEKHLGIARVGEVIVDTVYDKILQIGSHMPEPDPLEEKLKVVLDEEAKRIESPDENSMDKYPAKTKKYSGYPDNMTVELVKEMYIDKSMKITEIADHFKVPYAKANNFISKHKLHRVSQAPKMEEPKTEPDDKESHSQS